MRTLLVYGTTEGHTRALCQFAGRVLRDAKHLATVEEVGPDVDHPDPRAYDAVVLAGSLYVGRFQPNLVRYAQTHHAALNERPSAFLAISLCAAGLNPDDWASADDCTAQFAHETLWTPRAIHQAAGAIKYSEYDFFKRLVLKQLAARRSKGMKGPENDLTDYDALGAFVLEFIEDAARPASASVAAPLSPG